MGKSIKQLEKKMCTGCMVCKFSCPLNCIEIVEDELGFRYPKIDEKKCIGCGKCNDICPQLNKTDIIRVRPYKTGVACIKDEVLLNGCSSGGVATAFSKLVLCRGGVVYGAASVGQERVNHIRITKVEELELLKGSKYVQSNVEDVYKMLMQDLVKKKQVLFIGTPCQVDSVLRVTNNPDSLFTISFPCGGVPSQKLLRDAVDELKKDLSYDKIVFRDRRKSFIQCERDSKVVLRKNDNMSSYRLLWTTKAAMRWACWECAYSTPERVGDITIGDYFGIGKEKLKFFSDEEIRKGVSFIALTSAKGEMLFEQMTEVKFEEFDYDEIVKEKERLRLKIRDDNYNVDDRVLFEKLYPLYGLQKSTKRMYGSVYYKRLMRGYIKNILCKIGIERY